MRILTKTLYITALIVTVPVFTVIVPHAVHAQSAGNADAVMKRVKARLDGLSTLSCSFRREHQWKELGKTQLIEGTIRLRKPGRLRVEYPAQTIVSDGRSSWTYTPKNRQVTVTGTPKGEDAWPTPQTIFRRYATRKAESAGSERLAGGETDIIRLAPVSENEPDVTVWIDRALSFPMKTVEQYPNGDVTVSELRDVVVNAKIPDDVFTFKVHDGVDVVDMRE